MSRHIGLVASRAAFGALARAADRGAILLLTAYQRILSPAFAALGSQCRFEPSCSQYMIDAVRSRGAAAGLALGFWRLLRCNPLSRGGYDPAPAARDVNRDLCRDLDRELDGASSQDVSHETI